MARNPRDKLPRHSMLFYYMLESQAWKSLGAIPRAVYVDIVKRYYGTNNGRIGYSIRYAVDELHIGNATAKRALDALQDRGFIVPVKKGYFTVKQRNCTEWRLTQFKDDNSGALATKDFMQWTPDKNKTRYPQRNQTDAVAEASGVCSGSEPSLSTAHGVRSGSVKAVIATSSDAVAEHLYLTRSPSSKAVSEARSPKSAVASERPMQGAAR